MKKLHLLLAIITLFITQCALSAPVVEFYNKQQGSPDFVRLMIKNINTDKQVANPYVKRNAQWRSEEGTININDKLEVEVWTEAGKAVKFIVDAPGKTK